MLHRKGRKLPRDWKGQDLKFNTIKEAGLVDALEDTVRALERKQAMEREMLIYLLQGRESVQSRSAAKKLNDGTVCFGLVINPFFWLSLLKTLHSPHFFRRIVDV